MSKYGYYLGMTPEQQDIVKMIREFAERELDPEIEGPKRAPASDLLAGQFLLSGSLGVAAPAGALAVGKAFRSFATEGPSFGLADDYGLSRSFAVSAYGSYGLFGAPAACTACKTTSYSLGLGLVYHLVQGLAVGPWARYGLAYRNTSVGVPTEQSTRLLGGPASGTFPSLDFVSVALGPDYFPWPTVGGGLCAPLDVGRSISRPVPDEGAAITSGSKAPPRVRTLCATKCGTPVA